MRFGTRPFCLVRLVFGDSEWVTVPASAVCAEDIAQWPYTPCLLVKWVSFLGSLHWPVGGSWGWWRLLRGSAHSL